MAATVEVHGVTFSVRCASGMAARSGRWRDSSAVEAPPPEFRRAWLWTPLFTAAVQCNEAENSGDSSNSSSSSRSDDRNDANQEANHNQPHDEREGSPKNDDTEIVDQNESREVEEQDTNPYLFSCSAFQFSQKSFGDDATKDGRKEWDPE
nr:hypothetical protein Iba_chr08fCG0260 [Ipomoea batatas]